MHYHLHFAVSTLKYDVRAYTTYGDQPVLCCARNSGFTHEQGLACEKAGFHCKKEKDGGRALKYFQQARECYEEWGSSMKVDFIQKELERLNI